MSLQKVIKDIEEIESSIATIKSELTSKTQTSQSQMNVYYVEDESVTEPTMVVYIPKTSEENTRATGSETRPAGVLVYKLNTTNSWPTGTYSNGSKIYTANKEYIAVIQSDGNLVIYNSSGQPTWASGTSGNPGAKLAVQTDGNIVIYRSNGSVAWSSGVFNFEDANYARLFIDLDGKLKVNSWIARTTSNGFWLGGLRWRSG